MLHETISFAETLPTERLLLRRYCVADAPGILELVDKNRDRLIQDFPQMTKGLLRPEDAKSFVDEKAEQWAARREFCYGIWRNDATELIGQIRVKNIVWDVPSAELSYFIGSASLKRGYATEAISAILRVAFERSGFNRIFVRIIPTILKAYRW